jgi:eukaryotic-like serine/threonine-protein kinase
MATANGDRNLLFGILALQMDFISRDVLVQAMNAWVLDKNKTLGSVLQEQGALRDDTHDLLEALVRQHLALHGDDAEKSLAAVSSVGSLRDALKQIADPEVQASLILVTKDQRKEGDPYATREPSAGAPADFGQRFRILRPHARGGLGEVFVALDGELNREVALKEIQGRFADHAESRARFLVEAEITGGLEHPGIVPVYGLGHYADGRPFYAMRFIRGDSLKEAVERFHGADGPNRSPGERTIEFRKLLGRFIDVCNAIAYAHSRGVLHRDLKPGNIMLGKYGETLVVDWGLAKPLDQGESMGDSEEGRLRPLSAVGSAQTVSGSAVGTPQYMSPEQAAGRLDQLGPASDVYSLGATLYCLLTGQAPYVDSPGLGIGEILQKVQGGNFPPPRQVKRTVPAALEAICLRAMSLKPADRYASPRALADDVEHWLADEPVTACREPLRTRLGRWGRRHKPVVAGAAALLITAVAALAIGMFLLGLKQTEIVNERNAAIGARDEAKAEHHKAEQARDKAEAFNNFLIKDFMAVAQLEMLGKDVTLKKALDGAAGKIDKAFVNQPEVEASVRLAVGDTYRSLGLYKEAEPQIRRALDLRREHLGPEDPETFKAVNSWGMLLIHSARLAEAEPVCRDNLEARRRVLGPEHPDTLYSLHIWAYLLLRQEKYAEAEKLNRECLEARRRILGPEDRDTLMTSHNLAQTLYNEGKRDEAEPLHRQNLEVRRRVLGPEDPDTTFSMNDLALVLWDQGKLDEAEALFRQLNEIGVRVFGAEHKETLLGVDNLAQLLQSRGKFEEAERLYRQNLVDRRRVLGKEHPDTLGSMQNLASLLSDMGKLQESEALYREALDTAQHALGPDDVNTLLAMANLASFFQAQGKLVDAEASYRQLLESRRRVLGKEHPSTLTTMLSLGQVLSARGQWDEAEQLYRERVDISKRALGPEQDGTLWCIRNLANLLKNHGKLDEAEALYRPLLETRRRINGADDHSTLVTLDDLALLLREQNKLDEGEKLMRQALEGFRRTNGREDPETVIAIGNLAVLLEDEKKFEEAERLHRQVIEIRTKTLGAENPASLNAQVDLAWMWYDQGKLDDAERLTRQALEMQRRVLGAEHADVIGSKGQLATVLADLGKMDESERLYREVLAIRRKNLPAGHANLAPTLVGLGDALTVKGQAKEAEPLLREGLEIRLKTTRKDHWYVALARSELGACLTALGRHEEAEPLLLEGYEEMKASPATPALHVKQALDRIVKLYEAWHKPEKAAAWRAKPLDK